MTIRNDISYNLSLIKKEVIRWHCAVHLIYTVTLNKRIVHNNRNIGRTSHLRRLRRDLNELPGYCYCSLGSITKERPDQNPNSFRHSYVLERVCNNTRPKFLVFLQPTIRNIFKNWKDSCAPEGLRLHSSPLKPSRSKI